MKYKSKNLDFLSNDMKLSNLCYYNEHYYFECDREIAEAEIVSDEEFAEAVASIVVSESSKPEPTSDPVMEKLNAMEEKLNALTSDSVTVANVETAILEGVNEV